MPIPIKQILDVNEAHELAATSPQSNLPISKPVNTGLTPIGLRVANTLQ